MVNNYRIGKPSRLSLLAVLASCCAIAFAQDDSGDYLTVYPNSLTDRERPFVERYLAENRAIAERGPIDVQALIDGSLPEDTPGVGPVIEATPEMVAYQNGKYDPDNRLYTDADYARDLGYEDLLAYPTFGAHDDSFMVPFPGPARDKLLVSQLNHSVTMHRPIYPGDRLFLVADERTVTDLTPAEGDTYRRIAISTKGGVYNQRGEKVNDVVFQVLESVRQYREGMAPEPTDGPPGPGGMAFWIGPDWMSRPQHIYTDEDWERIATLWRNEHRQGAEPLYWEDVNIGDRPTVTVDGPVIESVSPRALVGLGAGGNRTLRAEILAGDGSLVRREDGIYTTEDREDHVPEAPGMSGGPPPGAPPPPPPPELEQGRIDTTELHETVPDERGILINYMARDYAVRHVNNWMGDHGWLQNIRWGIMPVELMADAGYDVPRHPTAASFLDKVPDMEGRYINAHGLTTDLAIINSYVYDKYYRNGEPMVELALWAESIDGYIWWAGGATVRLPSRGVN